MIAVEQNETFEISIPVRTEMEVKPRFVLIDIRQSTTYLNVKMRDRGVNTWAERVPIPPTDEYRETRELLRDISADPGISSGDNLLKLKSQV